MCDTNRQIIASIGEITDKLVKQLCLMHFSDPVTHVYNPLIYARNGYDRYIQRFGATTRSIVMVGMWRLAENAGSRRANRPVRE